jgi:hypothetical protein
LWTGSNQGEKWISFDFGIEYKLSRYVLRHAGDNGLEQKLNTKDYRVQVSSDGTNWTTIDTYVGNEANVTDIEFDAVNARYAKIIIDNAGSDKANIADVEFYGSRIQ